MRKLGDVSVAKLLWLARVSCPDGAMDLVQLRQGLTSLGSDTLLSLLFSRLSLCGR